jgi:putative membrane protein (TIGR04086 family)
MYQQDWLEALDWKAILIGVLTAVSLQIFVTFLIMIPLDLALDWAAVALVELCIAIGAVVAGWRARDGALINGVATALACAIISLVATTTRTPADLNLFSILFLFGTFAAMGALGGFIATRLPTRDEEPIASPMPIRRPGR